MTARGPRGGSRVSGWALVTTLLLALAAPAGLARQQAAQDSQYRYQGDFRIGKKLNDPNVPARAAAVVKFFSDLGRETREDTTSLFTWRWKKRASAPDQYDFNEGRFVAYSASAPEGAHTLHVTVRAGIDDPGYEIRPAHGGSQALVDGSSHPGREGFADSDTSGQRLPQRFVPLPGNGGMWLGYVLSGPRATMTCGAISVAATKGMYPNPNRTSEQLRAEIESYFEFITPVLTSLQSRLCDSGLCRCAGGSSTIDLLDGNPQYFKTPDRKGSYDFTDAKAARLFLDRAGWVQGALVRAATAREARKGVAADGVSLLILRAEVPSQGAAVFKLPGGSADGALYRIEDLAPLGQGLQEVKVGTFDDEDAGRMRHWALALYLPPKSFGQGAGERAVSVELTATSNAGIESKGSGVIRLVRPPVVLVHGTFDNPEACWNTKDIPESVSTMKARLESEGFRIFLTDWHDTNGQKDPSAFFYNRRVVWENPGGIKDALEGMRKTGFAATQADIVAHSQGALITRMYARGSWGRDSVPDDDYHYTSPRDCAESCEYHRPDNFAAGDIHRFITISATHYGSDICRVFETYRQFHDARQFVGDPVLDWWDGIRTETILALHPSREILVDVSMDPFGPLALLPWKIVDGRVLVDTGWISMFTDAVWKKVFQLREYPFTQGFRDQIPGSDGLRRLMKTVVPSHAIACVADENDMRTLFSGYYQSRLDKMWVLSPKELIDAAFRRLGQQEDADDLVRRRDYEWSLAARIAKLAAPGAIDYADNAKEASRLTQLLAEVIHQNAARFRSAAFGNSENDCTVRKESSFGGLSGKYTTLIPHVLHGPAPQFHAVQRRVVELLKDDGGLFAQEGFPAARVLPPAKSYDGPGLPSAESLFTPAPPAPGLRRESEPAKAATAGVRTETPTTPPVAPPAAARPAQPQAEPRTTPPAGSAGPAVLASDGTLQLTAVGCRLRRQGDTIIVTTAAAPFPGAPNFLKPGAVLRSIFDLADGRELQASGLAIEELARILNTVSSAPPVVLRFVLPDGEATDIQHPGRLPPGK